MADQIQEPLSCPGTHRIGAAHPVILRLLDPLPPGPKGKAPGVSGKSIRFRHHDCDGNGHQAKPSGRFDVQGKKLPPGVDQQQDPADIRPGLDDPGGGILGAGLRALPPVHVPIARKIEKVSPGMDPVQIGEGRGPGTLAGSGQPPVLRETVDQGGFAHI